MKLFTKFKDVDYWQQLSPTEKLWMGQFLDEYYFRLFAPGQTPLLSKDQCVDNYAAQHDCMNKADCLDAEIIDFLSPAAFGEDALIYGLDKYRKRSKLKAS